MLINNNFMQMISAVNYLIIHINMQNNCNFILYHKYVNKN